MSQHTATIKDIAWKAKVDVSIVPRVVNPHPEVSPEIQERMLRFIKQLDFWRLAMADSMSERGSETICFVVSDRTATSPFHSHIFMGSEQYARSPSKALKRHGQTYRAHAVKIWRMRLTL